MVEEASVVVEVLHLVVFYMCVGPHAYLGDVVGKGRGVVVGVVTMDEGDVAVAAKDDKVADLQEEAVPGVDDGLELYGFGDGDPVGDVDEEAVGVVVGVELEVGVGFGSGGAEVLSDEFGAGAGDVAQPCEDDALLVLQEGMVAEAVLYNHAGGVEVGDVAVVFGGLAFTAWEGEGVGEVSGEVYGAPHLVFPHLGLDVEKGLYERFHGCSLLVHF